MDALSPVKPYRYIAYIDESGDFGLRNVPPVDRGGASEWMVLSAVAIRADTEPKIVDRLRLLRVAAKNAVPFVHCVFRFQERARPKFGRPLDGLFHAHLR